MLKKSGITVIQNDANELFSSIQTGWRVCIDPRNLMPQQEKTTLFAFHRSNTWTLAGHEYYYFLDGYSGYNKFQSLPKIKRKPSTLVFSEPLPIVACPLGSAMRQQYFNVACQYFFDMVERFLENLHEWLLFFCDTFSECLHHLNLVIVWCRENNLTLN